MKKTSKLIAVMLAIIILLPTIPTYAAYAVSSLTNNVSRSKWMSEIKDDTSLSDISIPGTHDSAARIVDTMTGTWAQTQNMTITDQLNAGVRFLDLRVRYNTSVYYNVEMCHSSVTIWNGNGGHLTLYEVIGNVKDFLKNNPTETVICCIKEDDGSNESNIVNSINQIKAEDPSFWYQSYATPKLGDVRGKMVVASRMSSMSGIWYGWGDQGSDGSYVQPYSNVVIQDRYNMGTTAKWNNAIVPTFEYAKKSGQWVINCLNTTGGGISGVSANANTINPAFGRYDLHNNKCYGVVLFDYITDNYTTKVIKCNDLVTKRQPNPDNKEYYYRLNVNNPDSVPSGWSSCSLRLYYKSNNGTGYEGSELLFQNGDTYNGYAFVCQTGNYEFSGKITGYPTKVVFQYDWGYGSDRLELDFKLYVSKDPTSNYTQIMDTFFARTSGISSPQRGTDYFDVDSSKNPTPTSISFLNNNDTTISVPNVGSDEIVSNTFNAKVYDQYGVRWYADASNYSLSKGLNGVEFDSNTLKTSQYANDNPRNSEAYVLASYTYGGKTITTPQNKKIILNTNKIPYTFVDLDGNTLANAEGYYGDVPLYSGTAPTRDSNQNYHYSFAAWSPTTVSISNNVFKPVYNLQQHSIAYINNGPDASCTEDGYDTAYCDCGYSWQITKSATGHSMTSLHKDATCTEDGYDKTICTKCDYIQSEIIFKSFGHDRDNAIKGERIPATENQNSYIPYYCPNCDAEFEDMRIYSTNDYDAYNQAVKFYHDITSDPDYASFNINARDELERVVSNAIKIDDMESPYQNDIDNASSVILTAIDSFSNNIGINYYIITFIKYDGTTECSMYKEGTLANNIVMPKNTNNLIDDNTHTIFKWQKVYDVTSNATYNEVSVKSNHVYNTYIYPNQYVAPTCTEQGSVSYICLCGHTYTEYQDEIGHSFVEYSPNFDGTHKVICANDSNHYYFEDCDTNNDEGICLLCGNALDYNLYNQAIQKANICINSTSKYTANSLKNLVDTIEHTNSIIESTKSQSDINNATKLVLEAINSLDTIDYTVKVYYILDYDVYDKVEQEIYTYGDSIALSVPSQYNHYKTTIEINNKTICINNDEYIVNSDAEITVYMFS